MKLFVCDGCGEVLDIGKDAFLMTATKMLPITGTGHLGDYRLEPNEDIRLKFEVCGTCREAMLKIGMKYLHATRQKAA